MKLFKKLLTSLLISSILLNYVAPVFAQDESDTENPPVTDSASSNEDAGTSTPETGSDENPGAGNSETENDSGSENTGTNESGSDSSSEAPTNPNESSQPETSSESENESEENTTTNPSQPATSPSSSYSPNYVVPAPSTQPDYYLNESETTPDEIETGVEEDKSLLDGPYVAFTANIFLSEEEADNFISMIEEDEEAGNRFVTQKVINENDSVIVLVNYAEDASEEGRAILFYVETQFDTKEEAEEYAQYHQNIYPDLFFGSEVINIEDKYNVVFGIRSTVNTQKISYDLDTFEIEYKERREPFTYTVEADESGAFVDLISEAVEQIFPGEFTFEVIEISETEREVTMTPVEPQKIELESNDIETESSSESNE